MALGMTAVIITGGIDLSVGSIMGLVGVVSGLILQAGNPWYVAVVAGLLAGHRRAARSTASLIAYVGLSSFVVTLGMLSIARSLAVVLSQNQMIYEFGPDGAGLQGDRRRRVARHRRTSVWVLRRSSPIVLRADPSSSRPGAAISMPIGGNEQAARLTGVPVDRVKLQAYIFSALHGRGRRRS